MQDWYKDAIIYEVHVRAFFDSVTDGIGDFGGLTQKLPYLEDLGVTAVWLLPFCPSPLKDDGYDISDYTDVHRSYGSLKDFQRFMREAKRRGLKVITELVLNHTSDQHLWFQRSRHAASGSRWRDFYVWSDTPDKYRDARIIFKGFEASNWTWDPVAKAYYWHRFYSHQPDLNWENPEVRKAMFAAMDFWFDLGVDGQVEPEIHGGEHCLAHLWILPVQVWLVRVKAVPVICLGDGVPGPVGGFKAFKDDARVAILVRRVTPDIKIPPSAPRRRMARPLKPEMLVRRVVQHQFGNNFQAPALGFPHEALKVFQGAIGTVHIGVVGNVISVVF